MTEAAQQQPAPDRYQQLAANYARVVPVLGSGMTIEAGAPGFSALIRHLRLGVADLDVATETSADPFAQTEAVVAATTEAWVNQRVANFYKGITLTATPPLKALSRVRSGLIITTNYDLAIETAAEAIGRPYVSLTPQDLARAFEDPGPALRVLHLHGVCTDPTSIVLSAASYTRIFEDQRAQLMLRDIAVRYQLIFLGHRLAATERHIRRDLAWTNSAGLRGEACHLLLAEPTNASEPEIVTEREELTQRTGLDVWTVEDPDRSFLASRRVAAILCGPSGPEAATTVEPIASLLAGTPYEPLPVAEDDEVSSPGGHGSYMFNVLHRGKVYGQDLDKTISRLVLVGPGGLGKSVELAQVGLRSSRPALMQSLSTWNLASGWADPGRAFVEAMRTARGAQSGGGLVPRLTAQGLDEDSCVFLLDGLDEIQAEDRQRAIDLINAVSERYPQHRFVVTSRPLPDLGQLRGFTRYTLMPDADWLRLYVEGRGFTMEAVSEALPASGTLDDVIQIPVYAAAAVNAIRDGRRLPETALGLICLLADGRVDDDTRILPDPAQTRRWLDRIALMMEIRESPEVPASLLLEGNLHHGLSSISPTVAFLEALVTRALLAESGGTVRFPANVMGEARAGRALLEAGENGLQFLREAVLVTLAATHADGAPVRAIRPSWANTLEMLLASGPKHWRDAVAPFDCLLAARATPVGAPEDERTRAIWTLWKTYRQRQVWMSRTSERQEGNDVGAMSTLLKLAVPDGFADEILAAAQGVGPIDRGNALMLFPALVPAAIPRAAALEVLAERLRDENSVVRRLAAAAAHDLNLTDLVEVMSAQASVDDDELAPRTLLMFAQELATPKQSLQIALAAPASARAEALRRAAQVAPRAEMLGELLLNPHDKTLREAITEPQRSAHRAQAPWQSGEVSLLAQALLLDTDETASWEPDAERALLTCPEAAITALCSEPLPDERRYTIRHWLRLATAHQLMAMQAALDTARESTDPEARAFFIDAITSTLRWRTTPAEPHQPPIERQPGARTASSNEELLAVFADAGVENAVDPDTLMVSRATVAALGEAANRNLDLTPENAAQLFRFLLDWHDHALETWLQARWSPQALTLVSDNLKALTGPRLSRAAAFLPAPWPTGFATRVLNTAAEASDRDQVLTGASQAHRRGADTEIMEWAKTTASEDIDPVLVEIGSPSAEQRLISDLAAKPSKLRRHSYALNWLDQVRNPESAKPLLGLIREALRRRVEVNDLNAVTRAFVRCAGNEAVAEWDRLMADEEIPDRAFLIYQRREAITTLVAQQPWANADSLMIETVTKLIPA